MNDVHPSLNRDELVNWACGLYWCGRNRLSLEQVMSYQRHMALKEHHSYNAIRDGFPALHSARRKDVLEALSCASTWSLMTDGITEPTKMFAFLAVFVDRTTGELRCAFLDLTEIEAGVVLSWEDPAVAKECASMKALEAKNKMPKRPWKTSGSHGGCPSASSD